MQYKQAQRILLEIMEESGIPAKIVLKTSELLIQGELPKLGPYKKRSHEQTLWRMASDKKTGFLKRWQAVRILIGDPERSQDSDKTAVRQTTRLPAARHP